MEILTLSSDAITSRQWDSYVMAYNQAFDKTFTAGDFHQKYLKTIDGVSYHSLLLKNESVAGGCTVIPYNYLYDGKRIRTGLAVDVFILPAYRKDPLVLLKMYRSLIELLKEKEIAFVLAVPNDMAYSYWKNVVKWKDIGRIQYYIFPFKTGNILRKKKILLNLTSRSLLMFKWYVLRFISFVINPVERRARFRIDRSETIVEEQRYTPVHCFVSDESCRFAYRIVEEDSIRTAYLIDFYRIRNGKKDLVSLLRSLRYIATNESPDLVLYIGKLNFRQFVLYRVPVNREPKTLRLTGDLLIPEKFISIKGLFDYSNWDFGLFNYDVR